MWLSCEWDFSVFGLFVVLEVSAPRTTRCARHPHEAGWRIRLGESAQRVVCELDSIGSERMIIGEALAGFHTTLSLGVVEAFYVF